MQCSLYLYCDLYIVKQAKRSLVLRTIATFKSMLYIDQCLDKGCNSDDLFAPSRGMGCGFSPV